MDAREFRIRSALIATALLLMAVFVSGCQRPPSAFDGGAIPAQVTAQVGTGLRLQIAHMRGYRRYESSAASLTALASCRAGDPIEVTLPLTGTDQRDLSSYVSGRPLLFMVPAILGDSVEGEFFIRPEGTSYVANAGPSSGALWYPGYSAAGSMLVRELGPGTHVTFTPAPARVAVGRGPNGQGLVVIDKGLILVDAPAPGRVYTGQAALSIAHELWGSGSAPLKPWSFRVLE